MDSEHGGWEGLESERQTDKALIKNENIRKPNRRNNRREWREREREREREPLRRGGSDSSLSPHSQILLFADMVNMKCDLVCQ